MSTTEDNRPLTTKEHELAEKIFTAAAAGLISDGKLSADFVKYGHTSIKAAKAFTAALGGNPPEKGVLCMFLG